MAFTDGGSLYALGHDAVVCLVGEHENNSHDLSSDGGGLPIDVRDGATHQSCHWHGADKSFRSLTSVGLEIF